MGDELFPPIHHSPVNCDEIDLRDIGPTMLARAISHSTPGYEEFGDWFMGVTKKGE